MRLHWLPPAIRGVFWSGGGRGRQQNVWVQLPLDALSPVPGELHCPAARWSCGWLLTRRVQVRVLPGQLRLEGRANWHDGTRLEAGRGASPCRFESCPFRSLSETARRYRAVLALTSVPIASIINNANGELGDLSELWVAGIAVTGETTMLRTWRSCSSTGSRIQNRRGVQTTIDQR